MKGWMLNRALVSALVVCALGCYCAPLVHASNAGARGTDQELPPMTSRAAPQILRVTESAPQVGLYEKFELTIALTASYDNPFDPQQVNVGSTFISPSRRVLNVPGFFCQPYENANAGDSSKPALLRASGRPCWKVRFAPTEIGFYKYRVTLENHFEGVSAKVSSDVGRFKAVASRSRGFIRIAQNNRRYFRFDNGEPFIPVGQNLQNDWPVFRHSWMLTNAGADCARVWAFCHWTWLEWSFRPGIKWAGPGHWMRSYAGAGKYNQRVAWIFDRYLDECERRGLWVMVCLGNGMELTAHRRKRYESWGGHPYNAANGGFLNKPKEFWTDSRARELYMRRLRYIAARWGYSTHVWAWELWNELGSATPEIAAWHSEMAEYLHRIDPNHHLVTTSTWVWAPAKFAPVWNLDAIDFTQSHIYQPLPAMRVLIAEYLRSFPKPHVVGEGGGPSPLPPAESHRQSPSIDPNGIEFHNSLWAPLMLGAAGTTLPWWWRSRIEPCNLFFHYRAVANFLRNIPNPTQNSHPARIRSVLVRQNRKQEQFSPALIVPLGFAWGAKLARNRFTVEPDGTMPHADELAAQLFGKGRKQWCNPPTIVVNFPRPGKFIVHVSETSHGLLEIRVDGRTTLRSHSLNVPRRAVNTDFSIPISAGRHEIRLDNVGSDWVRIAYLLLTNYRDTRRYPDLDVCGRQIGNTVLLWVHNRLNQWVFRAAGFRPTPVGPATVTLAGLTAGRYRVEYWNTYEGRITRADLRDSHGAELAFVVPPVERDIALKVIHLRP